MSNDSARTISVQLIEQPPASAAVIQPATQTTRERFIAAIKQKQYVEIGYIATGSSVVSFVTAAPLDFGPSRKAVDKSGRYHMWSVLRKHVLSIKPEQLRVLVLPKCVLCDGTPYSHEHVYTFDPEKLVTWCTKQSPWFVQREWGSKS